MDIERTDFVLDGSWVVRLASPGSRLVIDRGSARTNVRSFVYARRMDELSSMRLFGEVEWDAVDLRWTARRFTGSGILGPPCRSHDLDLSILQLLRTGQPAQVSS